MCGVTSLPMRLTVPRKFFCYLSSDNSSSATQPHDLLLSPQWPERARSVALKEMYFEPRPQPVGSISQATNMANCCITYCATAGHRRPFCALRHNAEAYHGFAKHPSWSQPRSRFPTSFRTPRRQQERSGNRSSRVVPWGFGGTMATLSHIFGAQAQQMSFTSIFLWHDVDDVSVSMYERSSLKITLRASVLSDDARQVYPERRSSSGRVLGRWTWGRCDGASSGPGERHASLCLLRPATGKAKQFWRMPGEL